MVEIAGVRSGLVQGTMTAAGTLTGEIDLSNWSVAGLISDANLINSTLTFQVSPFSDLDTVNAARYVDVKKDDGSNLAVGPVSGAMAVRSDLVVQALAGYRYVKIKTAVAQTNGVKFYLPVKA